MTPITDSIRMIFRHGMDYRNACMEPMGLSGRHARYLSIICHQPGISQDSLTQQIGINKSSTARQVALLEEGGFITRTACPKDKRVTRLYPTEKSLSLLPRIAAMQDAWELHLTAGLTPEELETVTALLAQMQANAKTWTEVTDLAEA